MRIVHFCRWFSALSETFIYDSITELERQGLDNRVVTLGRQNVQSRPFEKVEVLARPGPFHPLGIADRVLARVQAVPRPEDTWLGFNSQLTSLLRRHRPNVLHAHFGREASLVAPIANRLSVPLVVSFYGFDVSKLPRDPWWRERYAKLWSEASAAVVLSREMHNEVVRLGCPPERACVVHLARRMDEIAFRTARWPVRNFISVGRLVEKKGHLDAVRAIHRLCNSNSDIRLDIIGEGPLKPELESLIDSLSLQDKVKLLGPLPNAETLDRIRLADAFLLCSRTGKDGDKEGTPTVLLEAQSLGLPCVATFHAGIPEMIPQENHRFLAQEGNVDEISHRLESLIRHDRADVERIAGAGQSFVRQNFDLRAEVGKLRDVYESVA